MACVKFKKHLKSQVFEVSLAEHDPFDEKFYRQLVLLTVLYKLSSLLTYLLTCYLMLSLNCLFTCSTN